MSKIDPSIDFVDSVLTSSVHALAIQSGSLVAKALLFACSSESSSEANHLGTSGAGIHSGTASCLPGVSTIRRGSRVKSSISAGLSSAQMDALFRLLEGACAASEEVRSACLRLCADDARDPTSSDATSVVRLLTELLAHSTEAPELENVQLVVSLLCCLTAHYSSDKLRAFVRVPRFVPAVLGAVALAPDQSAVCEPCLCTLRRLLEHRLVVLRADGSHEAGGWDEDDKPNTSVVRRKSEKSCRAKMLLREGAVEILHKALRAHMSSASLVYAAVALVTQLIRQYSRLILFYAAQLDPSGGIDVGGEFVRGSIVRGSFARTSLRLSALSVNKQRTRMAVKGPQSNSKPSAGNRADGAQQSGHSGFRQSSTQSQVQSDRVDSEERNRAQDEENKRLQRSALATIDHVERWLLPFLLDTVRPHFARRSRHYRRPASSVPVSPSPGDWSSDLSSTSTSGDKAQNEDEAELVEAILEQIEQICLYFDAEHGTSASATFDGREQSDSSDIGGAVISQLQSGKARERMSDRSEFLRIPGRYHELGTQALLETKASSSSTAIKYEHLQTIPKVAVTSNSFSALTTAIITNSPFKETAINTSRSTQQTTTQNPVNCAQSSLIVRIDEDIIEYEL